MASYMPIGVFGDLLQIGRSSGQASPADLRAKVDNRLAELEADLNAAPLLPGRAAELKEELRKRISDSLIAQPQMDLDEKIVFHHALDVLSGQA